MLRSFGRTGDWVTPMQTNSPSTSYKVPLVEIPQLVTILLSCAEDKNLRQGRHAHSYIVSHGFHVDFRVGNALIYLYGKCGIAADAQRLFETMSVRNLSSWNNILATYAHMGSSKQALDLFEQMQHDKFTPNRISILMVIFACVSQTSLGDGKRIHNHILGTVFEHDVVVRTALVNMYGKCGCIDDARGTFEGSLELDVVAWNAIMSVYVQHDLSREALSVFVQMQQQGELPNRVSLTNALSASATQGNKFYGKRIHVHIVCSAFQRDLIVENALINMYGKCMDVVGALQTFDSMPLRDVISWNALISAYARSEKISMAHQVFTQMHQEGVLSNSATYVIVLDTCSSPGVLPKGKHLHVSIASYVSKSNIIVENALVNMYGLCGKLDDALRFFTEMPDHNTVSFITLVSACVDQGAVSEGTLVLAYIMESGIKIDVMLGNASVRR
ncbi:hypothetical protein L7F22_065487 [Adiantum nelumboides]|nr:hypothetical protein [Adiantum nelumboides]